MATPKLDEKISAVEAAVDEVLSRDVAIETETEDASAGDFDTGLHLVRKGWVQ
jgi:hypothetical protein